MAQILPVTLVAPGSLGLNTEQELTLLPPEWATSTLNCVLDRSGRLASRKGWTNQTANPVAGNASIVKLHEYIKGNGSVEMICSTATAIFKNIDDFTDSANDITSSSTPTTGFWKFQNFNDKVVAWQANHTPVVYTGSGDFTDLSAASGTLPTGDTCLAAFGRVWAVYADKQTIGYSALLDETRWDTSDGGGLIDMTSVWTQGMDEVVAVAALGANLIVFGKRHIILWSDGQGSDIGIDPSQIYVTDTIEGTGCIARDSIAAIGEGDLWFLSQHGVQSLGRVIQNRSNPVSTLTKMNRTHIESIVAAETTPNAIQAAHSPDNGFYALLVPAGDRMIILDTRRLFEDDTGSLLARTTEWIFAETPRSLAVRVNKNLLLGFSGEIGLYNGNLDNTEQYNVQYESGWLKLEDQFEVRMKVLKELLSVVSINASANVVWKWAFDFNPNFNSKVVGYVAQGSSLFNVSEYNIAEYSGGLTVQRKNIVADGQGQFLKVGLSLDIDNADFVLQQVSLFAKLTRITNA